MTERIDPWGRADIEDYQNLFAEFGIESFEKYQKNSRATATYAGESYSARETIGG